MSEPGDKLSAAYRALPREEPGAALDAAILAASRRAVAARPFAARRWAAPMSIAAVLVLAFGVTLNMQRDQPGVETPAPDMYGAPPVADPTPDAPALPAPQPAAAQRVPERVPQAIAPPAQGAKRAKVARAQEPMQERDRALRDEGASVDRKDLAAQSAPPVESLQKEAKVVASTAMAPPPAPATAPAPAARAAPATTMVAPAAKPDVNEARGAIAQMKRESFQAPASPSADEITRELEAIAKLRVEGRHEEADKALAEFRRKHPGHRIADPMWERVKPR